jgi:lysophospholipase L1-like esterase
MQLLPEHVYEQYLQKVSSLAKQHGAYFLDLNSPELFTAKDFWDSVHLDGYGATRFMNKVVERLASLRELKVPQ